MNYDGSRIAVGVSSTWDEGEEGFKAHPVIVWLGVRKVRMKSRYVFFLALSFPPLDSFALSIRTLLTIRFVIAEVVDGKLILLGY